MGHVSPLLLRFLAPGVQLLLHADRSANLPSVRMKELADMRDSFTDQASVGVDSKSGFTLRSSLKRRRTMSGDLAPRHGATRWLCCIKAKSKLGAKFRGHHPLQTESRDSHYEVDISGRYPTQIRRVNTVYVTIGINKYTGRWLN